MKSQLNVAINWQINYGCVYRKERREMESNELNNRLKQMLREQRRHTVIENLKLIGGIATCLTGVLFLWCLYNLYWE